MAKNKSSTRPFDVFLPIRPSLYRVGNLKKIDTVFYTLSESDGDACEYVRRSLVNHDGYDPRIIVKKAV